MPTDPHRREGATTRRLWAATLTILIAPGGVTFGQETKERPAKAATPIPAPASGQIPPEVLRRVKGATVRIKVELPNGRAEGSGFFGVEPGVVLTNAHVLGMFKADSRRPAKVEVVLRGGEKDERTLPARILGVDVGSDLAVLRVEGGPLPEPLEVAAADELLETQAVYVFGFPFGSRLGRAITVSTSSVSSLRRDKDGALRRVQVNGGMNPGNSGGPVVDVAGRVVGVAVSAIGRTQINFAIPGEAVRAMLAGKVQEITMGQPYRQEGGAASHMELRLIDPLGRVGKVSLLAWSGPNAKDRAEAPPPPPPGDPRRREVAGLAAKDGSAPVEFTLPAASGADVYWLQPACVDGNGEARKWLPLAWPVKPPVDRTPVVLALKHAPGARNDLELVSNTTFTLKDSEGEEHSLAVNMKAGILETVGQVNGRGIADVRLKYSRLSLSIKFDGQAVPREQLARSMTKDLFKVGADLRVDARGALIDNRLDLAAVPRGSRGKVSGIAEKIQKSFEAVELTLPGALTEPNAPWSGRRDLPIDTPGEDEEGVVEVQYKYIGHRLRNGVDEALIDLKGEVKGSKGDGTNLGGRVQGLAFVDLKEGRVIQANVTTFVDMDIPLNGRPGKANGKLEVRLSRKPAAAVPPSTKAEAKEDPPTTAPGADPG